MKWWGKAPDSEVVRRRKIERDPRKDQDNSIDAYA